jgi:hypothetical protein
MVYLNSHAKPPDKYKLLAHIGLTTFSGVMDLPSVMGINCAVSFNRIHFDFSTNAMSSSGAIKLGVASAGYILPVNFMVAIVPVFGLGFSDGDHAGSYHCDILHSNGNTYYYNAGLMCQMKLSKNFGLYTGVGTFESFRMGITVAFL